MVNIIPPVGEGAGVAGAELCAGCRVALAAAMLLLL